MERENKRTDKLIGKSGNAPGCNGKEDAKFGRGQIDALIWSGSLLSHTFVSHFWRTVSQFIAQEVRYHVILTCLLMAETPPLLKDRVQVLKGEKKKKKERKKIATKKCSLGVAISAFRLFRTFTTCYALWVFENGTSQGALPPVLLFIARLTVPSLSSIYPWLLSLCYLTLQHWSQPRSHGLLFSGRPRAVTLTVKTKAPKNG